jgi:hypothetical protein
MSAVAVLGQISRVLTHPHTKLTPVLTTGYTPIFQVLKDGIDITSRLQDRLIEAKVTLTQGSDIGEIDLVFDDRDFAIQLPQVQDKISFLMGYKETGLSDFGTFEINEVHLSWPPRTLRIVGLGVSMTSGLKIPRIFNYLDLTIGDVVNQIASQAGVSASVDPNIAKIKLPSFNQNNQSGFHIIDHLARTYGGVAIHEDNWITIVKRDTSATVSGASSGTVSLTPEDFGESEIWIQSRPAYSGAQAAWFDQDAVERKFEQAESSGSSLSNFPLIGSEFSNPKSFFTLPGMFSSQEQAKAAATAHIQFLERLRAQASLTLAKGDPTIRAHNLLVISDMRDGIDGSYSIETVTHTLQKSTGVVTHIEAMTVDG